MALCVLAVIPGALLTISPTLSDFAAGSSYTNNNLNSMTPAAPGTPSALAQPGGSVQINWAASPSTAVRPDLTLPACTVNLVPCFGYNVDRSTTGAAGSWSRVTAVPATSLRYTDTPASDGLYYYQVWTVITSFTSLNPTAPVSAWSDRIPPALGALTCNGAACSSTAWYTSTVTLAVTATDGGSGMRSMSYSLDGGATITVLGNSLNVPVSTDSVSHSFKYWATDNAGNQSATLTQTFKLDATPPTISRAGLCDLDGLVPSAAGNWLPSGGTFRVYANVADATSGVASVSADGGFTGGVPTINYPMTAQTLSCGGVSYNYVTAVQTVSWASPQGPGTMFYDVIATDVAGNPARHSNPLYAGNVGGDDVQPSSPSALVATPGATGSAQIALNWTASADAGSGLAGYRIVVFDLTKGTNLAPVFVGASGSACSYQRPGGGTATVGFPCQTLTLTSGDLYRFTVQSSDNAGNDSPGAVTITNQRAP